MCSFVQSHPRSPVLPRYVAGLREWELPDDDTWHRVFLEGLADAVDEIGMAQRPRHSGG